MAQSAAPQFGLGSLATGSSKVAQDWYNVYDGTCISRDPWDQIFHLVLTVSPKVEARKIQVPLYIVLDGGLATKPVL